MGNCAYRRAFIFMQRSKDPDAVRDAYVDAMMRCEAARLSFEEEMRSVWVITGLFFLGILLLSAIADEPMVSLADAITSHL
jgi:hypothetical protein